MLGTGRGGRAIGEVLEVAGGRHDRVQLLGGVAGHVSWLFAKGRQKVGVQGRIRGAHGDNVFFA
jgi:hypothetical protein